jgi:hypothetical protein
MAEPTGYEDLGGEEQLPSSLRTPDIERALARLGAVGATSNYDPALAAQGAGIGDIAGAIRRLTSGPAVTGGGSQIVAARTPGAQVPAAVPIPSADTPAAAPSQNGVAPASAPSHDGSAGEKDIREYKAIEGEKTPSMPETPKIQEKPPFKPAEFQTFMGMALMFAALAGHSSRTPMTAGLNAFTGAIKGHMAGEHEVAERQAAEFKNKTDTAMKNYQKEMDKYKMILDDKKMRMAEKAQEIHFIAAEQRNQQMMQVSRERNLLAIEKAYNGNIQAAHKFTVQAEQMHAKLVAAGIESKEQAKAAIAELQAAQAAPTPAKTAPPAGGGQIIQRGGKSYRVVGHDTDGTPLVEPVQ